MFGWVYFCDYDKKKGKKTSGTRVFPLMAHQNSISLIWGGNKEEKSCCSQMTELSLISCFDYFSHFFSWMWFTVCLFVFFFLGLTGPLFFLIPYGDTLTNCTLFTIFFFFLGLTGCFFFSLSYWAWFFYFNKLVWLPFLFFFFFPFFLFGWLFAFFFLIIFFNKDI